MKLIKDVGLLYASVNSTKRESFGLYECPNCKKHFEVRTYSVNSGRSTQCRSCATRAQNLRRK